jgi:hypothetical protein
MERVNHMLAQVPRLKADGLLGLSGGSLAAREEAGIFVTPFQAAQELDWQLDQTDLVLFPGGGEASMARAGRRPCIDNRLHRTILQVRQDWLFSYVGNLPGTLAFAIAGQALELPHEYGVMLQKNPRIEEIPVTAQLPLNAPELGDAISDSVSGLFGKTACGAVLIGGYGLAAGATSMKLLAALVLMLERLALAQQWKLK